MTRKLLFIALAASLLTSGPVSVAQDLSEEETPVMLTLEDALRLAMAESPTIKVADKEIERVGYARKGTYASLFPQIDASGSYSRTIKKQVMYMDFNMGALGGGAAGGDEEKESTQTTAQTSNNRTKGGGIEVGRWNSLSAGVSASMPLVNAQLWQSIKISGQDVELAVEKARSSRLETITQVKQAFYGVLLSKEALSVYEDVYENALENFQQTERRYKADKASELEYTRAKSTVQNAIPNVYNAESSVILGLWQLKAVMGIDLNQNIDVLGSLSDYTEHMFRDIHEHDDLSLEDNSSLRQLAIQAEELANTIKLQKYAALPSLALAFNYSINAMTNDLTLVSIRDNSSPYSAVSLSLSIPIFAGGKRLNSVRQAKAQYEEIKLQQLSAERQLKISIRQYLNQMETALKTYTSAESGVETARKAYDIAAKTYNLGSSTITELNDAQLALTQAQLGVSQAIYNFIVAKASLEQTLGVDFNEE